MDKIIDFTVFCLEIYKQAHNISCKSALEVAQQNIIINSVAPGPTHSEITGAMPEMFAQIVPIKRVGFYVKVI